MIKNFWDITLRDWDVMEKTGSVSRFRSKWNILPVFLFDKRIESVRQELVKKLNDDSSGESEQMENMLWQTESLNNINGIKGNYLGLMVELKYKPEINALKKFYQKYTWRRLRLMKTNHTERYITGIKKYTGIEIKNIEDIEKVRKLLEFKNDKYTENFKPKETGKQEKIYVMGFALGVYSKLNVMFDPSVTTVIEFIDAKKEVFKMKPVKQDK